MRQPGAIVLLLVALIIGGSIVAASLFLRDAIDRAAAEIGMLRVTVAQLEPAVSTETVAQATNRQPARIARLAERMPPGEIRRHEIVTLGSPSTGDEAAKVVLVEFGDFQCPYCAKVAPTLARIKAEYGDQLRIVFKHLPLQIHPDAQAAHLAAEAAHRQGKFWEMHDRILANQSDMSLAAFEGYAVDLGLDLEKLRVDMKADDVAARIAADKSEAELIGVRGTPGFFINGRYFSGVRSFDAFKQLIDQEFGAG